MSEPERAPVQRDCYMPVSSRRCAHTAESPEHHAGTVAWDEHEEAWRAYHERHPSQDARRIADRGGFGYWELTHFLGHAPTTWRRS